MSRDEPLTGKQRRHLRALGHHLEPAVHIGKDGVTPGVLGAVTDAVAHHELIKIRVGRECPASREEVAERLADELGVAVAQLLGHTILVYAPHPTEPVIELPPGRQQAPGSEPKEAGNSK